MNGMPQHGRHPAGSDKAVHLLEQGRGTPRLQRDPAQA
jgi:hypothetical protein